MPEHKTKAETNKVISFGWWFKAVLVLVNLCCVAVVIVYLQSKCPAEFKPLYETYNRMSGNNEPKLCRCPDTGDNGL
jgi:hypothetical protein